MTNRLTHADTEAVSPRFAEIDLWPAGELVDSILERQLAAVAVVQAAGTEIATAANAAIRALTDETGRVVHVGAGTSGRLAVQDGAELGPTFDWPKHRRISLMAGGERALLEAVERAEDEAAAGRAAIANHGVGEADVVVAVAASGRTPFAVAALQAAREVGAVAIGIANSVPSPLLEAATHPIALPTGAEVVAGSTRMAAGTAQRAALTALSTTIMVGLGRTFGNLMVDVAAKNAKLDVRRRAIVQRISGVDDATAARALADANGEVRLAVLLLTGDPLDAACRRLERHDGRLRPALAERMREDERA